MTHPRMIIREATAKALYDNEEINKMVNGNVFVSRTSPLGHTEIPCIIVFTKDERTKELINDAVFRQELEVMIEVYHWRKPDMVNPHKGVTGLPRTAKQTQDADQRIDDICFAIEQLITSNYLYSNIKYIQDEVQKCVFIEDVTSMDTSIDFDDSGDVPYGIAKIKFTLNYQRGPNMEQEHSVFDNFTLQFNRKTCGDDPLDNQSAIESAVFNFSEVE